MNEDRRKLLFQSLADLGYAIQDDAIDQKLWKDLSRWIEQRSEASGLKPAGIGRASQSQVNSQIRGDLIEWLDAGHAEHQDSSIQASLLWLERLRSEMNRELFLGLRRCEVHVALYPPGTGYDLHVDQHRGQTHRKVTFILYLNENWKNEDGGQLELHFPKDHPEWTSRIKVIEPIAGRLVLFRSEKFPHRVLPAMRARKTLTGWFRDDEDFGRV